jgi:hypothetical protein
MNKAYVIPETNNYVCFTLTYKGFNPTLDGHMSWQVATSTGYVTNIWTSTTTHGHSDLPALYGGSGNTGGMMHFYGLVSVSSSVAQSYLGSMPVSPTSTTYTCPNFGIMTPLCDAFVWLFWPNAEDMAEFQAQINIINGKVPFGYLYLIRDNVDAWSTTSSSEHLAFQFWIPGESGFATTTLDITQAYEDLPEVIKDFNVIWLERIMWAMFMVYLIGLALAFKN